VDDNDDSARSLAWLIGSWGFDARVATDGRSGLELAAEYCPNVILCDVAMPGMSGLELARRLRANGHSDVALIAITAYGTEQDRDRTREAGFHTHFVKPVEPEELRRILRQCSMPGA
jgi:CheY-like chemotaxis protein